MVAAEEAKTVVVVVMAAETKEADSQTGAVVPTTITKIKIIRLILLQTPNLTKKAQEVLQMYPIVLAPSIGPKLGTLHIAAIHLIVDGSTSSHLAKHEKLGSLD